MEFKLKSIILIVAFVTLLSLFCLPAKAVLRQHHELPGVLSYHVHQSIWDRQGKTWQVVLFVKNDFPETTKYYLRLVGFPGLVEFIHPQNLEILTSAETILTAKDVFATSSPGSNVGQYDFTEI